MRSGDEIILENYIKTIVHAGNLSNISDVPDERSLTMQNADDIPVIKEMPRWEPCPTPDYDSASLSPDEDLASPSLGRMGLGSGSNPLAGNMPVGGSDPLVGIDPEDRSDPVPALVREGADDRAMVVKDVESTRKPITREERILFHQKLVHYVAARFLGSGESLEDLIQVGNIGLINALDRYDPSMDVKFSTYAMPTIVGEIKRHFRDKTWQVKVPRWLQELSINARKAQQSLSLRLGRSPTLKEIAAEIGAAEDRTLEALEINHIVNTISLDTRLDANAGGDSATLMDVIGRNDRDLNDIDMYSDLRRAIGLLDPREREVIEMRFFEEMSQAKIARELDISQMHVSRLQQRALQHLRSILADEAYRPRRGRRKGSTKQGTQKANYGVT